MTENPLQQPPQPNIDWTQTTELLCDKCNSPYFNVVTSFRKISKFMIGGDRDQLYPLQIIRCADCGNVNADLKPVLPGMNSEKAE